MGPEDEDTATDDQKENDYQDKCPVCGKWHRGKC